MAEWQIVPSMGYEILSSQHTSYTGQCSVALVQTAFEREKNLHYFHLKQAQIMGVEEQNAAKGYRKQYLKEKIFK